MYFSFLSITLNEDYALAHSHPLYCESALHGVLEQNFIPGFSVFSLRYMLVSSYAVFLTSRSMTRVAIYWRTDYSFTVKLNQFGI